MLAIRELVEIYPEPATAGAVAGFGLNVAPTFGKMQKAVYRVRTQGSIEIRVAVDLLSERQTPSQAETTKTLHGGGSMIR